MDNNFDRYRVKWGYFYNGIMYDDYCVQGQDNHTLNWHTLKIHLTFEQAHEEARTLAIHRGLKEYYNEVGYGISLE